MQLTAVVEKEGKFYVARVPELGVTSQGKTFEESLKNVKEAAELYLEDPYIKEDIKAIKKVAEPIFTILEVAA